MKRPFGEKDVTEKKEVKNENIVKDAIEKTEDGYNRTVAHDMIRRLDMKMEDEVIFSQFVLNISNIKLSNDF